MSNLLLYLKAVQFPYIMATASNSNELSQEEPWRVKITKLNKSTDPEKELLKAGLPQVRQSQASQAKSGKIFFALKVRQSQAK